MNEDQADKKRSNRSFQPGDKVFLKLQPYEQTSVSQRACHKLAFKFYGPFQVLAKIGAVAYRLQLPVGSLVHPVFHVSHLKATNLRPEQPVALLPTNVLDFQVPLKVLHYSWRKVSNKMVRKGRIRWMGASGDDTIWEDLEDLHRCFPRAPTWVPLCVPCLRDKHTGRKIVQQGLVHWSHSIEDKAKWEDSSRLRLCFPDSLVYGQSVFQEEVIVNDTPTTCQNKAFRVTTKEERDRPVRTKKPNSRVTCHVWVDS